MLELSCLIWIKKYALLFIYMMYSVTLSVEYTFTWMLLSVNLYDIQWYTHWHTSKYRIILRDDFAWTSQTPFPIASPSDPQKKLSRTVRKLEIATSRWDLRPEELAQRNIYIILYYLYIFIYLFIYFYFFKANLCLFFWWFFGVKFCDLDFVFAAAFTHQVKKIAGCAMVFRCAIVVFLCLCLSTKCHAYREFRRAAAHEEVKTFTPAATKRLMTAVGRSLSKIESRLQQQLFKNSQRSLHLGQSTFKNPLVRNLQRMQNAQNLGKYRFSSFPGAGKKTLMPQNLMPMISRRLMDHYTGIAFWKGFYGSSGQARYEEFKALGKKKWGGNLRCCKLYYIYMVCTGLLYVPIPIGSMYGIYTYIWLIFMVNVGKYTSPMDPMGYTHLNWYESIFLDLLFYLMPQKHKSIRDPSSWTWWD